MDAYLEKEDEDEYQMKLRTLETRVSTGGLPKLNSVSLAQVKALRQSKAPAAFGNLASTLESR